jgi:hypothetical protein
MVMIIKKVLSRGPEMTGNVSYVTHVPSSFSLHGSHNNDSSSNEL